MFLTFKSIIRKLVYSIPVILLCAGILSSAPQKRALIIAVGKYKNLPQISSAADVRLLKNALQQQGFVHIDTLVNEQATRSAMVSSLNKLAEQTELGDVVMIHFSAHGQQVQDLNGDEPDGLDETICAYDAQSFYSPGFGLSGHLVDDDLGQLLDTLRKKAGARGEVFVTIDACYSGSATRGDAVTRGGIEPMKINDSFAPENTTTTDGGLDEETAGTENTTAPLIVFSGARSYQKNTEYKGHGSLSFALCSVLTSLQNITSYEGLFGMVQAEMARMDLGNQNPVLEGNGSERSLFGGAPVTQQSFYPLYAVQPEKNTVIITAGALAGITDSSVIRFYEPGTLDPANKTPIMQGVVTGSTEFYTTVQITSAFAITQPEQARAFLYEAKYPQTIITVKVKGFIQPALKAKTEKYINSLLFAKAVDTLAGESDIWLTPGTTNGTYSVKLGNSGAVYRNTVADTLLKEVLKDYARSKIVRNLNLKNKALSATAELIPVKVDLNKGVITEKLQSSSRISKGTFIAEEGEYYQLRLVNTGKMPAFINVINIMEDSVKLLLPDPEEAQAAANLQVCDEYTEESLLFTFSPPQGSVSSTEIIKVIATEYPLDLRPVFRNKKEQPKGTRGSVNPLEELMEYALSPEEQTPVTRSSGTNRTGTTELLITVRKKLPPDSGNK